MSLVSKITREPAEWALETVKTWPGRLPRAIAETMAVDLRSDQPHTMKRDLFQVWAVIEKWPSALMVGIASAAIIPIALLIAYEVFVRSFFNWSGVSALEIGGYMTAGITFLAAGWTYRAGEHIQLGAGWMRSKRGLWFLDKWSCTVSFMISIGLLFGLAKILINSHVHEVVSYTPLEAPFVWPRLFMFLGGCALSLQILSQLVGGKAKK